MRITKFERGAAGLGSISFDTSDIASAVVKAMMPALRAEIPGILHAAAPQLQYEMPGLVDAAMPQVRSMIPTLVPIVAEQMPALMNQAMPIMYAKLPEIGRRVTPLLRAEMEKALDQYAQTYLGPAARFKEWAPALALAGTMVSLFASGIIIYRFWQGE